MKTQLRFALVLALAAALSGCGHVPPVNAKLIRYESSYPIGGTSITIKNPSVTETQVKADEYHRVTKLWGFSQTVTIEGYSRERTPADTVRVKTPAALAP